MTPLVSILIPAWNAEAWIVQTIQSALNQTWPRKEIIVVDDGSSDRTVELARRFQSPQLKVLTQANQGASAARNTAFAHCQGELIQWLDADDLLAPDKIARQIDDPGSFDRSRMLLCSAWGSFAYRVSKAVFKPTQLWCNLSPVEWLRRKLADNLYVMNSSWLVSRELSVAAGPWDMRLTLDDDGEYFCRVLLADAGTHFNAESKAFYRRATSTSLSQIGTSKLESQFLSMKLQVGYLLSLEDSPQTRSACLTFLDDWSVYFYRSRPDLLAELRGIAETLGGRLERPRLRSRYAWMEIPFGWDFARWAQDFLPGVKSSFTRIWDKALFNWEQRC